MRMRLWRKDVILGAARGAGHKASGNDLVVTKQADAERGPLLPPGRCRQDNGVQFLPLDAAGGRGVWKGPTVGPAWHSASR